jgi:type II secretion system protein H
VHRRTTNRERGFTLIEVLVTMAIVATVIAIVVPNLGALVPAARLDASGSRLRREIDWARSEARIQGKRMAIELDLQKARWRIVLPPDQQLARDQDAWTLEEKFERWIELEKDVVFQGAGDARNGIATHGLYRVVFDEYGFSADQVIALRLESDPTMVWSLKLQGLSGQVTVERSEDGLMANVEAVNEGAF